MPIEVENDIVSIDDYETDDADVVKYFEELDDQQKNLKDLDNLRFIFNKINIVENSILEEFDVNSSFFKIYYYGSPGKLKTELSKFGYELKNNQGFWQLYINE